jgi:MFS superfamily sulfate permease-like transporter
MAPTLRPYQNVLHDTSQYQMRMIQDVISKWVLLTLLVNISWQPFYCHFARYCWYILLLFIYHTNISLIHKINSANYSEISSVDPFSTNWGQPHVTFSTIQALLTSLFITSFFSTSPHAILSVPLRLSLLQLKSNPPTLAHLHI